MEISALPSAWRLLYFRAASCLHCVLELRQWMSHVENAAAINPAVFRILDYTFAGLPENETLL